MSSIAHEIMIENLWEDILTEVYDEWFPQLDEEQCESIAKTRLESYLQQDPADPVTVERLAQGFSIRALIRYDMKVIDGESHGHGCRRTQKAP